MRPLAVAILLASALLAPSPATAGDFRAVPILKDTLANYIRPSYAAFGKMTAELEAATGKLCGTASARDLQIVQHQFGKVVDAWSSVEWLRTGPVMSENRLERVLFYPDRKSTGLKQVQRAIASEDEALTDPKALAGASVAMQGLGAFEYLVYGTGYEALIKEPRDFRCRYALSIAANLRDIANEIVDAWKDGTPLAEAFVDPAPDNPLFRNGTEALNLILGTMIHGLEAIRDIRIGSFLQDDGNDRPLVAIYRRSGLTMDSVTADLEGLELLFNGSDFQDALSSDGAELANQVRFEFTQSIRTAEGLGGDIETLLADEVTRAKLSYLRLSIRFIVQRLNDEVAPAAGLAAGFSFGDGD